MTAPGPEAPSMEALADAMRAAMEDAAMSGLCRDGQIEIAVEAGRRMRPDLGDAALLALAESARRIADGG